MMTAPTDTSTYGSDDPGYYEALGRAIRVLRTERGLERKDLAEAAGLSYPYLSEIETGRKRPSSKALFVIAEALGVRPSEVLALGDRYAGRTSTGAARPPATGAIPPTMAPRMASSAPAAPADVPPAAVTGPEPRAGAAPSPAQRGRGSVGWRWFERREPRADIATRRPEDPASAGSDDPERHRLVRALTEAAGRLSNDDLAALLDLARRLGHSS
jgi:transcriptional regulator with XRE-family HTH domain